MLLKHFAKTGGKLLTDITRVYNSNILLFGICVDYRYWLSGMNSCHYRIIKSNIPNIINWTIN